MRLNNRTAQNNSVEALGDMSNFYVDCLLAERPSNMLVYLRHGSARAVVHAATLKQKLQIKLRGEQRTDLTERVCDIVDVT